MKAGAKGYLVKGTAPQQIRESVRRVAAGEALVPPHIAAKLAESMARPELSERERREAAKQNSPGFSPGLTDSKRHALKGRPNCWAVQSQT
jgi:DNA-binding NarL/FixJ family response regulator